MPVHVTLPLSAEMQAVADARETVKKAEAEVERLKSELKTAKAVWEEAVSNLNDAIDTAIDAERQPSLFSRLGDDLTDPPVEPPVEPSAGEEPARPEGEEGRRVTVEAGPALAALPAAAAKDPPKWRKLYCSEELDCPAHVFDAFAMHGVETLGDLADALVKGDRLGLDDAELREMKEGIRDVSADDDEPIRFAELEEEEDGERVEEAEEVEAVVSEAKAAKGKRKKPARKGA